MAELSTAAVRIAAFLKARGVSENEFRRVVDWSQGLLGKAVKRGSPIGSDKLERVLSAYPDMNPEWLLSGQGSMLRNTTAGANQRGEPGGEPAPSINQTTDPAVRYGLPPVVTIAPDGEPNIVMLDAQAAAGLPANVGVAEYFAGKPAFRLPGERYRRGTFIAIQVIGDSMEPTVGHLDWLIARYVEEPMLMLKEGYLYVLVAQDGVVAKRLFRAPGGKGFLCRSDNELYPPYELPLDEALQVWKVQAVMSEDLSNKGADIRERLSVLERDVMALKVPTKRR